MLLELDEDMLEEVALLFRDRLLNQNASTWNILGAPYGCSYPQAQQRRHADQEPSPYCSTTCDLQVVQPMLGVVVSRRITKCLGVPDSLYTWTTKLKKFFLRYVNWWRRTTSGKKIFRFAYWTQTSQRPTTTSLLSW